MEHKTSTKHENGNDANRLLAADWILVESQLPKRNENVLVKRKKPFHRYYITGYQRDGVFHSNETAKVLEGVIAWMPLPTCS
jgi:hypothetical protein